jgi:hypothetical protein
MSAAANSLISASDYNAIRSTIANVLGTGSGSFGYGQTVQSASKSANELVDQTDWDNLRYDIVNTRIHQTGSAFSAVTTATNSADRTKLFFSTASAGFLIKGMAVFGTGITATKFITAISDAGGTRTVTLNAATESTIGSGATVLFGPGPPADFDEGTLVSATTINSYETLSALTDDEAERFKIAAGQFSTTSITDITRTWSVSTTPQFWSNSMSCEMTIDFANANDARYFFNSGGEIRITSSRTGGRSDAQNNDWSSLLTTAGTFSFGAYLPDANFVGTNGKNFYKLTNAYQEVYRLTSSVPYAANYYSIDAKSNVANNSTGTATQIVFRINFIAGYVDPGDTTLDSPRTNDEIDGTFAVSFTEKKASGTILPTGNFTVTGPSQYLPGVLLGS